MAKYEERAVSSGSVILLLIMVFLMLFQPWQIGGKELYWDEGMYAAEAMEFNSFPPVTAAHGELIAAGHPLFPMAARALFEIGLPVEYALRLLSIIPAAAIMIWIFLLARSAGGTAAGGIAAAVWLTSNIVMEKTLDGYPNLMAVFFIYAGQFLWFTLGQKYNRWDAAWIAAGIFASLAFYTMGIPALMCFVVPFIFQRRPLSIKHKLQRPGAIAAIIMVALTILIWFIPYFRAPEEIIEPVEYNFSGYYSHLIYFPFDLIWRLLPWSLIAWPAFCAAYRPLDPTPIFSRFLRTLFISNFFLLWLSPLTDVRDMVLLVPPLAILIALNYSILMRRYGSFYWKILRIFPYLTVILGIVTVALFLAENSFMEQALTLLRIDPQILDFRLERTATINGVAAGTIIFLIRLYMLCRRKGMPLWVITTLVMTVPMLFMWAVTRPYTSQKMPKRKWAAEMNSKISNQNINHIYKWNISGLYGECFYLGIPVTEIDELEQLPKQPDEIFLLGTSFPQLPERNWSKIAETRLLDASDDERSLSIYRGKLVTQDAGKKNHDNK